MKSIERLEIDSVDDQPSLNPNTANGKRGRNQTKKWDSENCNFFLFLILLRFLFLEKNYFVEQIFTFKYIFIFLRFFILKNNFLNLIS